MAEGNDERTLLTYTVAALLVLGIACFNFVNLATARALRRAREVALRKVLGARRGQLIVQFLGESMLVAVVAMLLALAALELWLPALVQPARCRSRRRLSRRPCSCLVDPRPRPPGRRRWAASIPLSTSRASGPLWCSRSSAAASEAGGAGELRTLLVRRAIRGLDRPHRLRDRDLRPGALRRERRSGLPPRSSAPDRHRRHR